MFTPGSKAGVLFTIHSPYEAVNPFDNGVFMKPGRQYKIYLEMVSYFQHDCNTITFNCCLL